MAFHFYSYFFENILTVFYIFHENDIKTFLNCLLKILYNYVFYHKYINS